MYEEPLSSLFGLHELLLLQSTTDVIEYTRCQEGGALGCPLYFYSNRQFLLLKSLCEVTMGPTSLL